MYRVSAMWYPETGLSHVTIEQRHLTLLVQFPRLRRPFDSLVSSPIRTLGARSRSFSKVQPNYRFVSSPPSNGRSAF
jgi:hypothetical protein